MNRAHIKTKIIKTTQTQKSTVNDPYSRSGSFFVFSAYLACKWLLSGRRSAGNAGRGVLSLIASIRTQLNYGRLSKACSAQNMVTTKPVCGYCSKWLGTRAVDCWCRLAIIVDRRF